MARIKTILASDVEFAFSVLLPKLQTKALYLQEEYTYAQVSISLQEPLFANVTQTCHNACAKLVHPVLPWVAV